MKRTSAADVVRHFSEMGDEALKEPIIITRNGRDRLVLLNMSEFIDLLELSKRGSPDDAWRERLGQIDRLIAQGRQ